MARMVKNHPADAGDIRDVGLIPESGGSPGGGHGNPLQYSCLENPMDRGTWWAIVHGSQRIGRNRSYSAQTHEGNISLPLVRKYNAVIYSITTFMVNNKDVKWLKTNIREGHILCNAIILNNCLFCSVTQSCLNLCDPMNRSTPGLPVHHQLLEFTQTHIHQVCWCHPVISSSVIPSSSCSQSLPASECFPMSQSFTWGGQSTGVSALASFLPKKSQGWSPLEWTAWISLQSKELSRVFSNTTVQKHQFFSAQPSSQSNSHIHIWPLEKP